MDWLALWPDGWYMDIAVIQWVVVLICCLAFAQWFDKSSQAQVEYPWAVKSFSCPPCLFCMATH